MRNKLRNDFKILDYITSNEKYKAIFFVSMIVVIYGTLVLGIASDNFFDSILIPFQFPIFNILIFSLLFLNNLNLCSILKKDFSFYVIRLKNKKEYFKTLIRISTINYLFNFIIMLLFMFILLLLTTISNTSIHNYQNYNVSNFVYLLFYMFRYIIYGLLIMLISSLIYVNTNDKITLCFQLLFLSMFLQNNIINIYGKNNITLLIWSYFSGTTFSTFNLEILSSILVLLLLEFIYFFLFYISEKIKKVEIL